MYQMHIPKDSRQAELPSGQAFDILLATISSNLSFSMTAHSGISPESEFASATAMLSLPAHIDGLAKTLSEKTLVNVIWA